MFDLYFDCPMRVYLFCISLFWFDAWTRKEERKEKKEKKSFDWISFAVWTAVFECAAVLFYLGHSMLIFKCSWLGRVWFVDYLTLCNYSLDHFTFHCFFHLFSPFSVPNAACPVYSIAETYIFRSDCASFSPILKNCVNLICFYSSIVGILSFI